jgi:peptidoglycan-associated lipoprotein
MKRALFLNLLLAVLVALTGSVGCRKKPKSPTPIPGAGQTGPRSGGGTFGVEPGGTAPGGPGTSGQPVPPGGEIAPLPPTTNIDEMRRDEGFFKANTVYFDFDRSTIRSSERSKIEGVASHLKANPTHKIKVEGHCDERGTEGYNLALGERRAHAVREYLINLGIALDRVVTITYGEMRPAELGHNESAWAKNRRAEFMLYTPQ